LVATKGWDTSRLLSRKDVAMSEDPNQKRFRTLEELWNIREDLDPELEVCLCDGIMGSKMIGHPLVHEVFYNPLMNAIYNERLRAKQEHIEEALKAKKFGQVLWLYEKPYRFQIFEKIKKEMPDDVYWKLLGDIWTDSENIWQHGLAKIRRLISSNRPGREKMMDKKEQALLASLPDFVRIFRGHQTLNRRGFSWTFSYWHSRWFAERFNNAYHKPTGVVSGIIAKKNIVAVLLGRGEFEIVADPVNVMELKAWKRLSRLEWMDEVADEAWEQYPLSKQGRSVHGLWHWEKVERNALVLAASTPQCNARVVQLFALLHDSKRQNEDKDPKHGARAADYAKKLYKQNKLEISEAELTVLATACRHHTDGETSTDPTVGVCWDADRLDLVRVGKIPDPKYLSTEAGKRLMWKV
jgi:uncharacterized protein